MNTNYYVIGIVILLIAKCNSQFNPIVVDGVINNNEWPGAITNSTKGVWSVAVKSPSIYSLYVAAIWNKGSNDYLSIALGFNQNPINPPTFSHSYSICGGTQNVDFAVTAVICYTNLGNAMYFYVWNGYGSLGYVTYSNSTFATTENNGVVSAEFEISFSDLKAYSDSGVNPAGNNVVLFFGEVISATYSNQESRSSDTFHSFYLSNLGLYSYFPQYCNTYPYMLTASGSWVNPNNWLGKYIAGTGTSSSFQSNTILQYPTTLNTSYAITHLALYAGSSLSMSNNAVLTVDGGDTGISYLFVSQTANVSTVDGLLRMVVPSVIYTDIGSAMNSTIMHQIIFTGNGYVDNSLMNLRITGNLVINGTIAFANKFTYDNNSALVYEQVYGGSLEFPATTNQTLQSNWTNLPYHVRVTQCPSCSLSVPTGKFLLARGDMTIYSSTLYAICALSTQNESLQVLGNLNATFSSIYLGTNLMVSGQIILSTSNLLCIGNYFVEHNSGSYFPISVVELCEGTTCNTVDDGQVVQVTTTNITVILDSATFDTPTWMDNNGNTICSIELCPLNETFIGQRITLVARHTQSACYSKFSFSLTQAGQSTDTSGSTSGGDGTTKSGKKLGIVIGAAVGGAVLLTAILVAAILVVRKRKNRAHSSHTTEHDKDDEQQYSISSISLGKVKTDRDWEIPFSELEFGKELGRGAYGVVYKCRWRNTDCVAKQLDINRNDQQSIQQFLREANNVKSLRSHPNVCNVFGICTDPKHPICIVMEYLPEGALDQLVYNDKIKITPQVIVSFAKDIASGMSHIHQENVLHCDLACRNLLVMTRGLNKYQIKIADFGLSKVTETDTYNASTTTSFPVKWTAPETLRSGKITRASDVWSFGVVLWEIAEGRRPYAELSNAEVVKLVCDKKIRLPKPERVELPNELLALMNRCWEWNPENRPSFNEIYSELCKIEEKYYGKEEDETTRKTLQEEYHNNNNLYNNMNKQSNYYNNLNK